MQFTGRTGDEALRMRKERQLSQTEFWGRIGITQSGGSRYESGRAVPVPVQILLEIAFGSERNAARIFRTLRSR